MKKKAILLILLLLVSVCVVLLVSLLYRHGEPRGIDILVRNFTLEEYLLKIRISDEYGQILHDLNIPVRNDKSVSKSDGNKVTFNFLHKYDSDFESIVAQIELTAVNNNRVIENKILFWPGNDIVASGAGSNRLLLEIGIRQIEGSPRLTFSGVL